ncbi:MAG: hypothetical protein WBQ18_11385 [Solirubrobacteraceae bacterium]
MAHEPQEPPHDILAAEEYVVPAPDPALHREPPHDVLSAEEYAMPAPDPVLHYHGPVALPADPTGIAEPHDILAAEEFAMPVGHRPADVAPVRRDWGRTKLVIGAALALCVAFAARRRRS